MRIPSLAIVLVAGCYAGPEDALADREAIPDLAYCDPVRDWPDAWVREETRALEAIDDLRAHGIECGTKGRLPSVPDLALDGSLTCAARIHAIAMSEQGHVGHVTPDEVGTGQRIAAVEYEGDVIEHLAAGPHTGVEVVDGVWRPTDLHCSDLMSASHDEVGIGFVGATTDADPYETYWVVLLGAPSGT